MLNFENFSPSCERNKEPIYNRLESILAQCKNTFEVGSGSGQHAIFFADKSPHIRWQTSELQYNLVSLKNNVVASALANVNLPLILDVQNANHWPNQSFDLIYSANTLHIMSWQHVIELFKNITRVCHEKTYLVIYGPFKYQNKFTSDSNAEFDLWLKERDQVSGIRDFEAVIETAKKAGFTLIEDYTMPANNQLLLWQQG